MQVQKLRKTLTQMFQNLKQRSYTDLNDFYQIHAGDFQNSEEKRNITQHDQRQKTEKTRFNIKLKNNSQLKTQSQRKVQSVNLNKNLSHSRQLKDFNDQKQKFLIHKKRDLLEELQKIDIELRQCHQQKQILQKHRQISTQTNEQEIHNKASEFIRKMNKQRQEFKMRRKKSARQVTKSINQSIQIYESSVAEQEKIRQIKRQQMQKRIQQRKYQSIVRNKVNRRSNSVIKQLIDVSPLYGSLVDVKQRMKIESTEGKNPQNLEPHKSQKSDESLNSRSQLVFKKYEVSPFLEKLFKQDEIKKKQAYLKQLQRKRVAQKHKEYAGKIRGKTRNYSDSAMFIT